MPTSEKDAEFWEALLSVARHELTSFASAAKPSVVPFPYDGEEWKEQAQIDEKEDEHLLATEDFIRSFCRDRVWPRESNENVRYFTRIRLEWAVSFFRVFVVRWEKTNAVFLPRPKECGHDMLEWLLIDGYRCRNPSESQSPMRFFTPGDSAQP